MRIATLLFCFYACFSFSLSAETPAYLSDTQTFTLQSDILQESRPIIVSLPDGYTESDARYPVVYLLDATQNMRHAIGTADILTRTGSTPPVILVGIHSVDRDKNFTPSRAAGSQRSGGGPSFLRFIEEELKPHIDKAYCTHPYSILEGHSLGGTFAIATMMTKPDAFNAYIAVAPALWWNEEEQIKKAQTFFKGKTGFEKTAFFTIGEQDGDGMRRELRTFIDALPATTPNGFRWHHEELAGEGHMSAPLRGHYNAMKFIFSDIQTPTSMIEGFSKTAFLAHEAKIAKKYGPTAKQTGESYTELAFALYQKEDIAGALAVFERNAKVYPKWHMNFYYVGKMHEKLGNKAEALNQYKEAQMLAERNGDEWATRYKELIATLESPGTSE